MHGYEMDKKQEKRNIKLWKIKIMHNGKASGRK